MKKILLFLPVFVLVSVIGTTAYSAQVENTLNISADYVATCTLSTTPVTFGAYNGTQIDADGAITVNCTIGVPFEVALDAGAGGLGTGQRAISDGNDPLPSLLLYELFSDPLRDDIDVWGTGPAGNYAIGNTVSDVGTGTPLTFPVFGRLFGDQAGLAGAYSDIVNVFVNY